MGSSINCTMSGWEIEAAWIWGVTNKTAAVGFLKAINCSPGDLEGCEVFDVDERAEC